MDGIARSWRHQRPREVVRDVVREYQTRSELPADVLARIEELEKGLVAASEALASVMARYEAHKHDPPAEIEQRLSALEEQSHSHQTIMLEKRGAA